MAQPALQIPSVIPEQHGTSRTLRLDAGTLPQELLSTIRDLENAIASGRLQLLKLAPEHLEQAALTPGAWSGRDTPKWKRMLLVSGAQDDSIALKVFRPGEILRRVYYSLPYTDPYKKAFAFHRRIESSPINSVKALAHGRVLQHGLLQFSFFAMERLQGVQPVSAYLQTYLTEQAYSKSARAAVLSYAAKRLAEMHCHGFFHKDIKPYHCFVETCSGTTPDPEQSGPWRWVDLDRCRLHVPLTMHERITNLYQFWRYILKPLGEDDSREFLGIYLEHSPDVRLSVAELEAKVFSHYEKRIARAVERGRLS